MPDRSFPIWRQPPVLWDRVRTHPGDVAISASTTLAGVLLIIDAFTPWSSAVVLGIYPWWVHFLIGVPLTVGGALSCVGLMKPSPRVSLMWEMERSGILIYTGAWAGFIALIVWRYLAFPFVPVIMLGFLTAGILRLCALAKIESYHRSVKAEVEELSGAP